MPANSSCVRLRLCNVSALTVLPSMGRSAEAMGASCCCCVAVSSLLLAAAALARHPRLLVLVLLLCTRHAGVALWLCVWACAASSMGRLCLLACDEYDEAREKRCGRHRLLTNARWVGQITDGKLNSAHWPLSRQLFVIHQ